MMDALTIDAGIDLGTTNSAIAVLRGVQTDVIQHGGRDYMPSAVWIDKRGNTHVGERANDALANDRGNVAHKFKRLMGSTRGFTFERSGKCLQPEELSAEVLKQLKAVYFERTGRDLLSAVVSVPAEFDLPQIEATKRAAQLAGIGVPALVQEPVAAALAYGFQLKPENEFWLVYDWGGGTFDVALIQIREGAPRVIGHGGDTFLGGSDIDRKIVESVFLQELSRSAGGKAPDGRQKRRLEIAAEAAKIRLSQVEIVKEYAELVSEAGGEPLDFDFTLTRDALETLTEPLVLRTIELCKRALAEAHLKASDVARVILVGGPTMMPVVRRMLADEQVGLGIPVDTTVDPMTAVARGAAIFAGSRLLPTRRAGSAEVAGQLYRLEMQYQPVSERVEFPFGGRLAGREGQGFSGFTVEVRDDERKVPWRSGKCPVDKEGRFILTLLGEEARQVMFSIEAFGPTGSRVAIEPSRFPYTVGMSFTEIRLNHDLRVALKDGRAEIVVPRGLQIPAEGIKVKLKDPLLQTTLVRKGSLEQWLRIPLVEGRSMVAARNTPVGSLEVTGVHLQRDIPAGSDVELSVKVSQDRIIDVVAYIPVLDEEFEARFEWKGQFRTADSDTLKKEVKSMERLLNDVREQARGASDTNANAELEGLLQDGTIQEIEAALPKAGADAQAAQQCLAGVEKVSQRLDEIESRLKWPVLLREAQDVIGDTRKLANELGDVKDRSRFVSLEREMLRLMSPEYVDELRQKLAELYTLRFSVLNQQPSFLADRFRYFERRKADMTDQSLGERLIAHGHRAITENDMEALRSVNRQLSALVPWGEGDPGSYGSTVLQQ